MDGDRHVATWGAIREFGRDLGPEGALLKLACVPSKMAALIRHAAGAARECGDIELSFVAHAGSGVLYVSHAPANEALIQRLQALATEIQGSAVVEQAPAAVRDRLDVWGPVRDDFRLMRALKDQFDPHRTLNPGRFVGRL
jgi:glycolate oxidase FAD binding subunit